MKATLFLLSILGAGYAVAAESIPATLAAPITGSLTIADGQSHSYTRDDATVGEEPEAFDLGSGTVSVSGQGSALTITTNGGLSLASNSASDNATLEAVNGGVITMVSTAASQTTKEADEWFKFYIASSSPQESEQSPTATLKATGEGSQIILRFGAFTGRNNSSIPVRGGFILGAQSAESNTSEGTVNILATDGGSIMLHDDGKSALAPNVHSFIENLNIIVSGKNSAFSSGAYFQTNGTTSINISNHGTVNFGMTTMSDGTPRNENLTSTQANMYYEYNTLCGGRTLLTVDGAGSSANFAGTYRNYSGEDVITICNGGTMNVTGSLTASCSTNEVQGKMRITISGTGSSLNTTSSWGLRSRGGFTQMLIEDGGTFSTGMIYSYNHSSYMQHQAVIDIVATGQASTVNNNGDTYNDATLKLSAIDGALINLGYLECSEGAKLDISAMGEGAQFSQQGEFWTEGSSHIAANGSQSTVSLGSFINCGETVLAASDGGMILIEQYSDTTEEEYKGIIYYYTPQTTINLTQGGTLVLGTPSSAKMKAASSSSFTGATFNIDGSSAVQSFGNVTFTDSTFNINEDSSGQPAIVIEEGATLNWGAGTKPNEINLTISPALLAGDSAEFEVVIVQGQTNYDSNQQNVVVKHNSLVDGATPDQKTDAQDGENAFVITASLSEEGVAAAHEAFSAAGTGVANALHSSVGAVRGLGAATLNQLTYRPATSSRFWVQGLGDFERTGSKGTLPGYHYNGGGYALGYDRAVTEQLTLGAAFGEQSGINKTRMDETRVRQRATMGMLYGRYSYGCPRGCITRVVDGYASYGSVRNRGRSVLLGERATGRWNDDVFNIGLRFGWQVPLNTQKSWTLTPFIGLEYSYGSQGDARIVSENYERLYHDGAMQVWSLPVGATLQGRYAVSNTRYLLPELTLAYVGDLARRNPRVKATVLGKETSYRGIDPGRNALHLQVGTRYTLTESVTAGLFYGLELRARETEQSVNASVSVSF